METSNDFAFDQNTPGFKKKYKKGDIIYHEDTPSNGLYFVISGIIKVYNLDDNGKEIILRLAGPGDILGHHFIFHRYENQNSAKVISNSVCHYIEKKTLLEMNRLDNLNFDYIIAKIGEELLTYQDKSIDLVRKNVRERLASFFCYMAKHHSEIINNKISIKVQLSREEIASMIGTANETAIRFISEFKEIGLIEEIDRSFKIIEMDKMIKLARTSHI